MSYWFPFTIFLLNLYLNLNLYFLHCSTWNICLFKIYFLIIAEVLLKGKYLKNSAACLRRVARSSLKILDIRVSYRLYEITWLNRKMVEDATAKNNFSTLTAKNGTEGLNLIETKQISLVVVDLHLKNPKDPQAVMDGEEFLQRLADLKKD